MAWRNGHLCRGGRGADWRSSFRARVAVRFGLKATGRPSSTAQQDRATQVARGRAAFNDGNFKALGGNGRACADCHMPSDHFQLSPAAARARFEALMAKRRSNKNADDPLFRPVDADDFRMNGDNASDFSNLVENGLVRVTLPLPPNVASASIRRRVNRRLRPRPISSARSCP